MTTSVPDAYRHPQRRAVLVGLQAGRAYAVRGKLLVALLRVAGDADGADQLSAIVADQHAAALGEDLPLRGAHQVAHEERALLGALAHDAGRAAEGERGIGLAHRHLESHHRRAVLLP